MSTREIPREEWPEFLESFSRVHEGWLSTVEVLDDQIGSQVEARDLPLQGIAAEWKEFARSLYASAESFGTTPYEPCFYNQHPEFYSVTARGVARPTTGPSRTLKRRRCVTRPDSQVRFSSLVSSLPAQRTHGLGAPFAHRKSCPRWPVSASRALRHWSSARYWSLRLPMRGRSATCPSTIARRTARVANFMA